MSALENKYKENIRVLEFTQAVTLLYPSWENEANCRGVNPSLFYPERGVSTSQAKEVCESCQVKDQCLESAVQRGEKFGIWGGLSERERREIRRDRRLKSKQAAKVEAKKQDGIELKKVVGLG